MRKGVNDKQVITILNNNGAATDTFKLRIKGHGFESGTEVSDLRREWIVHVQHERLCRTKAFIACHVVLLVYRENLTDHHRAADH